MFAGNEYNFMELAASPPVVFEGGSATLSCTVRLQVLNNGSCNHTNCARFTSWKALDDDLGLVTFDGSSSEVFSDGVLVVTSELHLNSITLSNDGYYTCQINYGSRGTIQSVALSVTG